MFKLLLTILFLANSLFAFSIAAVAGYKKPISEISKLYEKKTGQKIELIFGNQAQVMASLDKSDNIKVVVGDINLFEKAKLQLLDKKLLGYGSLVLAYSKNTKISSIEDLTKDSIKKIIYPDPKKAIYGKATMEFLKNTKLEQNISTKLLSVATVPQISSYLISNEVDVGFINLTNALSIKDSIGGFLEIDEKLYNKIEIVISKLKGDKEVDKFFDFLNSAEVKTILKENGLK